jgi:hypothetical protein
MARFISKGERMLLMTSQAATNAEWLPQFLKDTDPIDNHTIDALPADQKAFLLRWKETLVTQASKEWVFNPNHDPPIEDLGPHQRTQCSLTGTPNRFVFYIVNRFTQSELNVGSECVKRFGFGLTWQGRTSMTDLKSFASEFRIRNAVATRIPSFQEAQLHDWHARTEQLALIIPASVESRYIQRGNEIRTLYDALLKGHTKDTPEAYARLAATYNEGQQEWQVLEQYVQEHRGHPWMPTAQIRHFLRNAGPDGLVAYDFLKQDGQVTSRTLHRITEPDFMNSLVEQINRALASVRRDLVERAEPDRAGYVLRPMASTLPGFLLPHRDFFLAYANLLFDDAPNALPTLEQLVSMSDPLAEKDSDFVMARLAHALRGSGLTLLRHDVDHKDLLAYDGRTFIIAQGLPALVRYSAPTALGLRGPAPADIRKRIVVNSRPYSREELALVERYRDPSSQY